MCHVVAIFYILYNLGTRIFFPVSGMGGKGHPIIYATKTTPSYLIVSFSPRRVSRLSRVSRQNSYVPPNNALCTSQ